MDTLDKTFKIGEKITLDYTCTNRDVLLLHTLCYLEPKLATEIINKYYINRISFNVLGSPHYGVLSELKKNVEPYYKGITLRPYVNESVHIDFIKYYKIKNVFKYIL